MAEVLSLDDCIRRVELAVQEERLSDAQRARVLALGQQLGPPYVNDVLESFDMPVVTVILALLDNRSYAAAACTCRTFASAAVLEETFEALSRQRWTAQLLGYDATTDTYTGPYKSWKARILDDNREHAVPTLDFRPHGLAADWLGFGGDGQTNGRFYRCKVMALQCYVPRPSADTQADEIVVRLFFDAWGEPDLRDPLTSTLGLPDHDFHIDRAESNVIRHESRSSMRMRGHLTFVRRQKKGTATTAAVATATKAPLDRLEQAKQLMVGHRDRLPFFFVNSARRSGDYSVVQLASRSWQFSRPILGTDDLGHANDEWADLPSQVRERWGS